MIWDHRFLLDADSSPPSGGAAAESPAETGGVSGAPTEVTESQPGHDQFAGMESNDYDFIDLGSGDAETGDGPGAAPPPPAPQPAEGVPPAPATTAPPVPQAPQAPPTPAAVAPTGDVPGAQAPPQPPRSQLEQTMEGLRTAANQTALADWAAGNLFKLSEEDAGALEANPSDIIPKLMGRVYTRAMESAVNLIKNLVPEMVDSGLSTQSARTQRASEALNEFYRANPHLSADQHGAAVDKWARSFRAMNPGASRSEAITFVGRAVSAEFGVWPQANGSGQASAPGRQAPAPFAPARQGGRAAPPPARGTDPYAGMEDDFDQP